MAKQPLLRASRLTALASVDEIRIALSAPRTTDDFGETPETRYGAFRALRHPGARTIRL